MRSLLRPCLILLMIVGANDPSRGQDISLAQSNRADEQLVKFRDLVRQLASEYPNECVFNEINPLTPNPSRHKIENDLLFWVDDVVLQALRSSLDIPILLVTKLLLDMERISAEESASWPEKTRFHFEILDLQSAFVLKQTIRSRNTFTVFEKSQITSSYEKLMHDPYRTDEIQGFDEKMEIHQVMRGQNGVPRFLAKFSQTACAGNGSFSINYDLYEVKRYNTRVFHVDGGNSNYEDQFYQANPLQTSANVISIPYCWSSALDMKIYNLCSVDSYDVSGDIVKFVSRTTNHPDLETVARVIQYAQVRDITAIRGYTTDDDIASLLVQQIPDDFRNAFWEPDITRLAENKINVVIDGNKARLSFDLVNIQGRWLVAGFKRQD